MHADPMIFRCSNSPRVRAPALARPDGNGGPLKARDPGGPQLPRCVPWGEHTKRYGKRTIS